MYAEAGVRRVVQVDGVRTTVSENRFEIIANYRSEIMEQQAVQALREWIRWRKEQEVRQPGDMPG